MSKQETNSILFRESFSLPNPGLRAYLSIVERGNDEEYRTPFYKGKSLNSILADWIKHIEPLSEKWPTLYDFEIDLSKKVGPMSIMKPLAERMDDIDAYYDSIHLDSKPISSDALAQVQKEWSRFAGLRIRTEKRTVENMKKSTNSGSPYFTKRKTVTDKTIPLSVTRSGAEFVLHQNDGKSWKACATLGWRGQEGGPSVDDVKQRVVWMFPYGVNVKELQVYQPLIVAAQKGNLVPAWVSMEAVDAAITKLFDTKGKDDLVICTDFSKFDQHFNAQLQDAARILLSYIFKGDVHFDDWSTTIFPIKYEIPLCYGWDKIRTGSHGMGSGSGGTNADETLAHRALQYEAALASNAELNPYSQCLGDDGILSYPGCTVDNVLASYTAHGLEMNQDKQYASKHDCTYLRRWHHEDYRVGGICVGVYATTRALGRLCEQERYYDPDKWSNTMVALRQLSILENVKYHPLREEFVAYCMKGDKYRLGLDIPGFLDNIDKHASEAIEYMPDFLGYTKSLQTEASPKDTGISSWWIVQYLKSLA